MYIYLNESPCMIHAYSIPMYIIGKNRMYCNHHNDDDYSSPDCGLRDLINLSGYVYTQYI